MIKGWEIPNPLLSVCILWPTDKVPDSGIKKTPQLNRINHPQVRSHIIAPFIARYKSWEGAEARWDLKICSIDSFPHSGFLKRCSTNDVPACLHKDRYLTKIDLGAILYVEYNPCFSAILSHVCHHTWGNTPTSVFTLGMGLSYDSDKWVAWRVGKAFVHQFNQILVVEINALRQNYVSWFYNWKTRWMSFNHCP